MAVTDKSVYLDQGNGNYLNLFNSGKIAMLWTGPWDLSSINSDVELRRADPARGRRASTRASPGPTTGWCSTTAPPASRRPGPSSPGSPARRPTSQFTLASGDLPTRASETKLPVVRALPGEVPGRRGVRGQPEATSPQARPNTKTYPQVSQAIGSQIQGVLHRPYLAAGRAQAAAKQADSALASGRE